MALSEQEKIELELINRELDNRIESPKIQGSLNKDPIETTQFKTQRQKGDDLKLGAAVGLGGALVAKKLFFRPADKIKGKEKLIDNIKKSYLKDPFVASEDVPNIIRARGDIAEQELKINLKGEADKLKELKSQKTSVPGQLKKQLAEFDDTILAQTQDEFAETMITQGPKIFNKTYKNYGEGLNVIEAGLIRKGKQLSSDTFVTEVLDKTIADAIANGVPEENLGKLTRFRNNLFEKGESEIVDSKLKPFKLGQKATIRQLKGNVKFLSDDIPKEATFKFRENWGKFLEKNAPEAGDDLVKLNKSYSEFAKFRNATYKSIDAQTGLFDKTKMNRMVKAYSNSKVKTGLQEVANLLAEGNDLVPKSDIVTSKFNSLKAAKQSRTGLIKASQKVSSGLETSISGLTGRLSQIEKDIAVKKLDVSKWAEKSSKILSEQKNIVRKHPIRSGGVGKAIAKAGAVAETTAIRSLTGGALRSVAFYPILSMAAAGFSDPIKGIGDQLGVDIPVKGTVDRAVLENNYNSSKGLPQVPYPDGTTIQEINEAEKKLGLGLST